MFAASGSRIESKGENQFQAISGDGFLRDCTFIFGAVKKILKTTAITFDEGVEKCQLVIHTKTGGWIINCKTKTKIPFERVRNTNLCNMFVEPRGYKRVAVKSDSEESVRAF